MAKAKNTTSDDQNNTVEIKIFDVKTEETPNESIESLIQLLEDIETKISEGKLTISEQINELNNAKLIAKKIKLMLEEVKTQINVIENE